MARVHVPTAGLARSRGASPARPSRPPLLRVLPGRRATRAGTARDLASYDIFRVFSLTPARPEQAKWLGQRRNEAAGTGRSACDRLRGGGQPATGPA